MAATKPKLTTKQAKFVKAKIEGKTGTAAAMEAYGVSYNTARSMAAENMAKPSIQEALHVEFAKQGITLEAIVKPIADGLKATKQNEYTGEIKEDHSIRLKSSSMAAQFMGIGKTAPIEGGIHFHNHVEEKKGDYEF